MINRAQRTCCLFLAAAFCGLAGCGRDGPELVPVAGQVLIDGRPLTVGQVMLTPSGYRPSIGAIDSNGRFVLSCYEIGDGVVRGTHQATITAAQPLTERSNRWHAPKKYANLATSGLNVSIEGPTDDLKIDISWAGGKPFVEKW